MTDQTTMPLPTANDGLVTLASDDALRELFERDPLSLTRPDFETMLAWARAARSRWVQEEREARGAGRKPRTRVAALPAKAKALADLDPDTCSL